jgi:hypothetical protein
LALDQILAQVQRQQDDLARRSAEMRQAEEQYREQCSSMQSMMASMQEERNEWMSEKDTLLLKIQEDWRTEKEALIKKMEADKAKEIASYIQQLNGNESAGIVVEDVRDHIML